MLHGHCMQGLSSAVHYQVVFHCFHRAQTKPCAKVVNRFSITPQHRFRCNLFRMIGCPSLASWQGQCAGQEDFFPGRQYSFLPVHGSIPHFGFHLHRLFLIRKTENLYRQPDKESFPLPCDFRFHIGDQCTAQLLQGNRRNGFCSRSKLHFQQMGLIGQILPIGIERMPSFAFPQQFSIQPSPDAPVTAAKHEPYRTGAGHGLFIHRRCVPRRHTAGHKPQRLYRCRNLPKRSRFANFPQSVFRI